MWSAGGGLRALPTSAALVAVGRGRSRTSIAARALLLATLSCSVVHRWHYLVLCLVDQSTQFVVVWTSYEAPKNSL